MFSIYSFRQVLALTLIAALGTAGFHPARASSLDQATSMTGRPRGAMTMAAAKAGIRPAIPASAVRFSRAQRITLYILPGGSRLGFIGPDHSHHDTVVPSTFVLWKGTQVIFTVINFDDMRHSITAPGLDVDIIVKPGKDRKGGDIAPATTTYTFTPTKTGEFRWFCVFPCDLPHHWAMSASYDGPDRDGFMAGIFRVL